MEKGIPVPEAIPEAIDALQNPDSSRQPSGMSNDMVKARLGTLQGSERVKVALDILETEGITDENEIQQRLMSWGITLSEWEQFRFDRSFNQAADAFPNRTPILHEIGKAVVRPFFNRALR